jgi:hypothetical protein
MGRIKLLIATLIILNANINAQTIKGRLLDLVDNKPLRGATLSVTSLKDSTQKFNTISDSSGKFEFENLYADSFTLNISFIGYEDFKQIVGVKDSATDLGTLFIPKSIKKLREVTVNVKTPPTVQKGDTTQFNASQFKVNPDATTEDLIKKMPGITVDKDGTVTAQGDQVKKVTVDGRDFFGDDATAALRNLPSSVVDKIQVFDRLSDQAQFTGFDDGNSVKAINIVTKSGIKNGQFGRMYAGYGTDDRYSAGGNVSFFKGDRRISLVGNFNNVNQQNFASQDLLGVTSSGGGNRGGGGNFGGGNRGGGGGNRGGGAGGGGFGGFGGGENFTVGQQSGISKTNAAGINFGDKWGKNLDVTGSYFFNNSNNLNDNLTKQQIIGTNQLSSDSGVSKSNNYNHRINLRLEYRIDSLNSIIVSPSLNFQRNKSTVESDYYTLNGTDTLNTQNSNSNVLRTGYNLRNNILFRHSFKSNRRRTFSVNFGQTFNKNNAESYIYSDNRIFKGGMLDDSLQNQYINNPTNGYALSGNISYTEPLGKKSMLQVNYQPSYSKNNADQETFSFNNTDNKYSEFISGNSNKFENTTTTQNGGITYRLGATRDNQFSVGVSLQHSRLQSDRIYPTITSIDQSFTNLLPNLMWRKKFNVRNSINLFYRASTNFPSVTQLQDVVNNSNLLKLSIGNPDLKQSYNHFLSARYIFTNTQKGQSFFANIFLNAQQNYISNAIYIASKDSLIQQGNVVDSGAQLIKPVNLNGYKSFRSFFTFSQPVKFIKSSINLNTGFSYTASPALYNNKESMTNNYTYNAGIVVASNISEYIDFNLNYNANFNVVKNSVQNLYQNYVNRAVGIQFNLLSKNGWYLQNDLTNQTNTGLSAGLNQNYWLWNAAIGKKFLKNKSGELKLYAFDLLKQNQSITRTIDPNNPNYITDSRSIVLQQYFMLTFTYSLKNFGKPPARTFPRRDGNRIPGF